MTYVYGLRSTSREGAHKGFKYPLTGIVEAPDWREDEECGGGLHFLPWGEGDGTLLCHETDAVWQLIRTSGKVIDLDGKSKTQSLEVVQSGNRLEILEALDEHRANRTQPRVFQVTEVGNRETATAGDYGTATAGEHGTATAGTSGTAIAGEHGTATAGWDGTATAGEQGTATAGYGGTATAGDHGTAIAGGSGTAIAGEHGTATVEEWGTATAEWHGTAIAGEYGTATAGCKGKARAGENGRLQIEYYDTRWRIAVAYVGEDGILPDAFYKVDNEGNFIECQ